MSGSSEFLRGTKARVYGYAGTAEVVGTMLQGWMLRLRWPATGQEIWMWSWRTELSE